MTNSRGFLLKQRAFLKLYLLEMIEQHKGYGFQMKEELQQAFREYGYRPTHPEIYKTLHELAKDGWVKRERRLRGMENDEFQEIILYHLTDYGKEQLILYKKQMKVELDRCLGLLHKAVRDLY